MYNFVSSDQLPLFVPVSLGVLLKTWFDSKTIDQGLELLRQGELTHFFIHRNSAACMFGESGLHIIFEQNLRIKAGFTLKQDHCEFCGYHKGKRCHHLAALAILSLYERQDGSYAPLSLSFGNSVWKKCADFFYSWLGAGRAEVQISYNQGQLVLSKNKADGELEAKIDTGRTSSALLLDHESEAAVHAFSRKIQEICTTKNERILLNAGGSGRGLQQDCSIWSDLCTLAYVMLGDVPPEIDWLPGKSRFQLQAGSGDDRLWLRVLLPRSKTTTILKNLGKESGAFQWLGEVQPGSNVSLEPDGKILVSPIVRMTDGRVMALSTLERNKFGNHYYLPGEGFFAVGKSREESKIIAESRAPKQASLLDFLHRDDTVAIEIKDIADFLERNEQQLRHPDNEVAREVLEIRFISVPDRLILTKMEEEDGWVRLACRFGIGDGEITLIELRKMIKKRQPLSSGFTTLTLDDGPLAWLPGLLGRKTTGDNKDSDVAIRLTRGEFACIASIIPEIQHEHDDVRLKQTFERLKTGGEHGGLDNVIRYQEHLRDYQKEGLTWLYTLYELGLGGILADDMGLGKTHQALALIETIVNERSEAAPVLVVCPASVLLHWADKIDHFYSELSYTLYYGLGRDLESAMQTRILLTTYGTVRRDRELLVSCDFDLLVFDEIQALKNRNTATHQACRALAARMAIGLSGTPIENSLEDLFALFSICLPGFFGTFKAFQYSYITPIEKFRNFRQEDVLSERISPFVLRRTRGQVLVELPALIEDERTCDLSEKQLELYRETVASQQPLLAEIADEGGRIDYLHVFAMLTKLKQICDHPCLVEKCSNPNRYPSGKWDLFVELLNECLDNGRKVVVFSQYLGMLDLMATHFEHEKIGYGTLRGDMSVAKRKKMIDTFAGDKNCRVFTSSLLAGGTGIDLIAGSVVIHYDRWWNPAKEDQATARVHRMGQKDVVQLFRLNTRDTLETKINDIIESKKQLSESILKEDELGMIKQLSRNQLLELFSV